MPPKKETSIEEHLTNIECIVEKMEAGDLALDQSLRYFEQGIKLVNSSQQILKNTEQKVQILLQQSGDQRLDNFDDQ